MKGETLGEGGRGGLTPWPLHPPLSHNPYFLVCAPSGITLHFSGSTGREREAGSVTSLPIILGGERRL